MRRGVCGRVGFTANAQGKCDVWAACVHSARCFFSFLSRERARRAAQRSGLPLGGGFQVSPARPYQFTSSCKPAGAKMQGNEFPKSDRLLKTGLLTDATDATDARRRDGACVETTCASPRALGRTAGGLSCNCELQSLARMQAPWGDLYLFRPRVKVGPAYVGFLVRHERCQAAEAGAADPAERRGRALVGPLGRLRVRLPLPGRGGSAPASG